ncbi:hypothetical protein D3C75_750930 [compost metagenome]
MQLMELEGIQQTARCRSILHTQPAKLLQLQAGDLQQLVRRIIRHVCQARRQAPHQATSALPTLRLLERMMPTTAVVFHPGHQCLGAVRVTKTRYPFLRIVPDLKGRLFTAQQTVIGSAPSVGQFRLGSIHVISFETWRTQLYLAQAIR